MSVEAEDRWTPVRSKDGQRYCSPGCGWGCTYTAYQVAKARAEELAAGLGPGFQPYVHENLGWHWAAESKDRAVYIFGSPGAYTCLVDSTGHMLHAGDPALTGKGTTPSAALADSMAKASELVDRMSGVLEALHELR